MIIPSIDLMNGSAVQLVQGREKVLDAGDPTPIADAFAPVGEIAVIDLDAALGQGSNADAIERLLPIARCRVGGGIRSADAARRWLDAGAAKVILGSAATPDVLAQLPRERLIAALDAMHGEVVTHGWRTRTGARIEDRMRELRPFVSGFLVTFVETEGTMQGLDAARARALRDLAGDASLTVAGGIARVSEIAALDALHIDAQVGMGLYTGAFSCADALAACLRSDRPDGLWPTLVVDELGLALGLTYSNLDSLRAALAQRRGVYWSRTRGLWRKGDTSGAAQHLLRVDLDCDRDTLRFTVRQQGPFCHTGTRTCFGDAAGLPALASRIARAAALADDASYTRRLLADPALLRAKLREECDELAEARDPDHAAQEAADVAYFLAVAMHARGVTWSNVADVLDRRALRLSRRPGHAKPQPATPAQPEPRP